MKIRLRTFVTCVCTITALVITPRAGAQVLLSDDFERVNGVFGDIGPPPIPSVTDWGSFNNALGGTVSSTPYIVTQAADNNIQSVGLDESGDYDDDGDIDGTDFLTFQRQFGTMPPHPR